MSSSVQKEYNIYYIIILYTSDLNCSTHETETNAGRLSHQDKCVKKKSLSFKFINNNQKKNMFPLKCSVGAGGAGRAAGDTDI